MTTFEIISPVLNLLFVGGGIVTAVTLRAKHKQANEAAKAAELANSEKELQIVMGYIVEPLKKEINELRKDVRRLNRAINKIAECPHAADCPVKRELQNSANND